MSGSLAGARLHFGIGCSCGAGCMTAVSREHAAIAKGDPVAGLRLLGEEDQRAAVEFYVEHKRRGHEPEPLVCEIAPMGQA
jgi:hypothetical protein